MVSERDRTLEGLRVAVQMEIDGKEFYLKASRASSNEMGRKLLESLSIEEDLHRQKFEQIYEALQQKKSWPGVKPASDFSQKLKTLFARQAEEIGNGIKVGLRQHLFLREIQNKYRIMRHIVPID